MQEGVIREQNRRRVILWKEDGKIFIVPMRSYQIPFFSVNETVYFDSRTGYCFRKEQKYSTLYAHGMTSTEGA